MSKFFIKNKHFLQSVHRENNRCGMWDVRKEITSNQNLTSHISYHNLDLFRASCF